MRRPHCWLGSIAILLLFTPAARAQPVGNPFGEIYLSAQTDERIEFNESLTGFTSFQFFVLVDVDFADDGRPQENDTNGLSGWEVEVRIPPEVTVNSRTLTPVGSTNAGSDDNFLVTLGSTVLANATPFSLVTYDAQVMMATVPEDLIVTLGPAMPASGGTASPNWFEDADGTIHPFLTSDSRFVINCAGEPECGGDISEPLGSLYLSSTASDRVEFNEDLGPFSSFTIYLTVAVDFADIGRGGENAANGVFAWEAGLTVPPEILISGVTFNPMSSVDVGAGNDNFIVGTGAFIRAVQTPAVLAELSCILAQNPAPEDLVITMGAATPSSLDAGVPLWITQIQRDTHPFADADGNRFVANCKTEPECDTTPVALIPESLEVVDGGVVLRWQSLLADGTFRVSRRELSELSFVPVDAPLRERAGGLFEVQDDEVRRGRTYEYRVEFRQGDAVVDAFQASVTIPVAEALVLAQNQPNPFNPRTTIEYQLAEAGRVTLAVYDARGRWVVNLVDAAVEAGGHEVIWDGRDAAGQAVGSGVYHYRLTTRQREISRQMMLLR